MPFNVRVEYENTPIRHIAVQCPKCKRWYDGRDITDDELSYDCDIYYSEFICPVCGHVFGANGYRDYSNVQIEECDYSDVYKDCLRKKEVWE